MAAISSWQGYNNWTNGLYGYSWDMMVHTWDTVMAVVKVVDHETGQEHFLDPEVPDCKDKFLYIQLLNFSKMVHHSVTVRSVCQLLVCVLLCIIKGV